VGFAHANLQAAGSFEEEMREQRKREELRVREREGNREKFRSGFSNFNSNCLEHSPK
jgi:hypothetical protein